MDRAGPRRNLQTECIMVKKRGHDSNNNDQRRPAKMKINRFWSAVDPELQKKLQNHSVVNTTNDIQTQQQTFKMVG
jgi:hypothetical protein